VIDKQKNRKEVPNSPKRTIPRATWTVTAPLINTALLSTFVAAKVEPKVRV
jgi:hypothetical protein